MTGTAFEANHQGLYGIGGTAPAGQWFGFYFFEDFLGRGQGELTVNSTTVCAGSTPQRCRQPQAC